MLAVIGWAAACGGGDGGSREAPSPTPDAFDSSVLSAIVLQPDEMQGYEIETAGFVRDGATVTFNITYFDGGTIRVNSTVVRAPDSIDREIQFSGIRSTTEALIRGERTYDVEGSDRAFAYRGAQANSAGAGAIVLKENFIFVVRIGTSDLDERPVVFDDATLRRYIDLMNERIDTALIDPSRLTPAAGLPTLEPAPAVSPEPTSD
jgi:hypothetical protein